MWDYVFSPRHMMFDAASGVVFFILFRLLRGSGKASFLERAAFMFVALSVSRWYLGGPPARAVPSGYIGQMVAACAQDNSQERCLCAVDAVEGRIGHPALTQLAMRAGVNMALPPEMTVALAECSE